LRTLAVAAAVVVIVVGGFHSISRLFEDGSGSSTRIDVPSGSPPSQNEPPHTQSAPPQAQPEGPARKEPPHVDAEPQPPANAANLLPPVPLPGGEASQRPAELAPEAGSISSPAQAPGRREGRMENRAPETAPPAAGAPMDITGSLPNAPPATSAPALHGAAAAPAIADRLPAAIGGSTLRLAAIAGDPLAAYEVGVRFSEGRGVPASNEEAAHRFEIAAKKGIVPAQFRLGTLYEKGLGVKKDLIAARDLYHAAAEKGHGKAMHNLAVIYAEGPDGKPDYATAAQWFRKESCDPLCARRGRRAEFGRILQVVLPCREGGRPGCRAKARRNRFAHRPGGACRGPRRCGELDGNSATRRRDHRKRRLGPAAELAAHCKAQTPVRESDPSRRLEG
jgi:localization factor PodJL